jgi:hypothetical protein
MDAQDALASMNEDRIAEQRELARRLIGSVTLRKSTRGRWDPIADRVTIEWRSSLERSGEAANNAAGNQIAASGYLIFTEAMDPADEESEQPGERTDQQIRPQR